MFALPISKPRFKNIIFYQNSRKIKLLLQKNAKFSSAGGFCGQSSQPPEARGSGGKVPPPDPQNSPPIANFWLRA